MATALPHKKVPLCSSKLLQDFLDSFVADGCIVQVSVRKTWE